MLNSICIQNVFGDLEISSLRRINLFQGSYQSVRTLVEGLQLLRGALFYPALGDNWTEIREKTQRERIYNIARWLDTQGEMRVEAKKDSGETISLVVREVSGQPEMELMRKSAAKEQINEKWGFAVKFLYREGEREYSVDCLVSILGQTYVNVIDIPNLGYFSFKIAGVNLKETALVYNRLTEEDKYRCCNFLSIVWGEEIRGLMVVPDWVEDTVTLYIEMNRDRNIFFPLSVMGASMCHIVDLAVQLVSARYGIFVVDGIDEKIHSTELKNLWQAIAAVSEEIETQVFAITYNQRCVELANQYFNSRSGLFSFYPLP